MSQNIFSSIDPTISGTTLATTLNNFKDAIVSGCSGTSRPAQLQIGGAWVDTTNDPNSWAFRIWTGTDDVTIFTIDLVTGVSGVDLAVDSFIIKKISADTAGAILELVKRRVATSGQVLSGDVVGEIRLVGRTNAAGNPVVGKIIWTATDDQTATAYGGTLSFYSTPDGTATLTEHLRFINGLVETVVPHKLNSQIIVSQNVATAATITQLSATKRVVEMTGSTNTDIQGINSGHDSQVVSIHNRSTAVVTLKHLNGGASAGDQIKLPNSADFVIAPEATATLYYCMTNSKWKLVSTSEKVSGSTIETLYGITQTWTAPATVTSIEVKTFKQQRGLTTERTGLVDVFGNAFAMGANTNGVLGINDVNPRSSPVAVLGGLVFERVYGVSTTATYGIANNGTGYAWGLNTNGQLGTGTVTAVSNPTAITGGIKFLALYPRDAFVTAVATNMSPYAWGINTNGQLGTGTVTPTSAPTAVLGGLRFSKMVPLSGAASNGSVLALTQAGVGYAWGINTNGNLGDGSVIPKSSPVAILGGLTFRDILGGATSSRYFGVGLTTAGAAYAWGNNASSQLGVGDQNSRSSPVAVLGGLTFSRLFLHPKSETVYGLTTSGALYAWGDNANGQVGDGTTVNKSSPVAVLGGLTFVDVFPFRSMVIAETADGTLYAWGLNSNGQLGVGDVTPRSSPVAVLGGLKFNAVAYGDGPTDAYSVYGTVSDGSMYAWGANANGTLGVGDVTPRSSPVAVLGMATAASSDDVTSIDLTVTGGTPYTVTTGPGTCTFGNNLLGRGVYKVAIKYIQ